jgi:hypothetical protein
MAILQSRARYGLSAFSFLKPELPGNINNEPGPQLDCAAAKFLPRSLRGRPARSACAGTSLLAKDSAAVSGAAPARCALATWLIRRRRPGNGGPDCPAGASATWRRSLAAGQSGSGEHPYYLRGAVRGSARSGCDGRDGTG